MKLRALLKPLIIYGIVSFLILTSLVWPATIEVTLADIFMDQLALFTTNNLDLYLTNAQMIVQGITNFLGRVGFLMAGAIVYNQKSL